jgi:hypothetical protein
MDLVQVSATRFPLPLSPGGGGEVTASETGRRRRSFAFCGQCRQGVTAAGENAGEALADAGSGVWLGQQMVEGRDAVDISGGDPGLAVDRFDDTGFQAAMMLEAVENELALGAFGLDFCFLSRDLDGESQKGDPPLQILHVPENEKRPLAEPATVNEHTVNHQSQFKLAPV